MLIYKLKIRPPVARTNAPKRKYVSSKLSVGTAEGARVGLDVGAVVGIGVGTTLGAAVDIVIGATVGEAVGVL